MGGAMRETLKRHARGDSALKQLEPGAILVATVLPLAALALEARWAIQYDDDEEPDMEGFEYALELMERGGMMGAFSLAYSAATGFGDTTARAAHLAGPTAGHILTLISDEKSVLDKMRRSTPFAGQIPQLWD